jgi:hypothetical protein
MPLSPVNRIGISRRAIAATSTRTDPVGFGAAQHQLNELAARISHAPTGAASSEAVFSKEKRPVVRVWNMGRATVGCRCRQL